MTSPIYGIIDERARLGKSDANADCQSAQAKEEVIMKLRSLLAGRDETPLRVGDYVKDVMHTLMTNFVIRKGGIEYEIIEAEFYLYCHNHRDITTYPRHIGPGRFWFHDSGVDITLGSTVVDKGGKVDCEKSKFGGILIRSLKKREAYNEDGSERIGYVFGPQNCVAELWADFDAFSFDTNNYPVLEYRPLSVADMTYEKRFYPVPESEDKRERKLKTLRNRFADCGQTWEEVESFLNLNYRAVRSDIAHDEQMQNALKGYQHRNPSPCPDAWLF